jgi:hypothetical protein
MSRNKNIEFYPTSLRDLGVNYQKAFVTFIDILGFRQIVCEKLSSEINSILDLMNFVVNLPQRRSPPYDDTKYLPMVLQFSDSIIRIQPVDEIDIETFIYEEICSLIIAQGNLVCKGFLVRGALTYGDICVHKNRILGPAFNKAYFLESSIAIYPRIIVDELLCKMNGETLKRDFDGQWYIDYLPHLYDAERDSNITGIDVLLAHRDSLIQLVETAKEKNDSKVLCKINSVNSGKEIA